ncbi:Fc.00g046210.m01.CDS01 [Cosmosporella sp. VM-42]
MGITADSHTERLSSLAAHVLSLDNTGRPLPEDGVWGRIFLQLLNQVECVKAAAAAFGAAYELLLNHDIVKSPCSAWRYYGSALARLQSDFNNETAGPESLALASIILACAEILSQHEDNASAHFLGAVQIISKTYPRLQGGAQSASILGTIKNELVKIDVLIGSYSLSQTPQGTRLEFREAAAGDDAFREPELAINAAMFCLYRSRQFIESAAQLRYTYPSWKEHDPIMCKDQSDAVTQFLSVLDGLAALATRLQTQYSSATSTLRDLEMLAEIYAIRTQLTATLIYILCVHNPFQTGYDEHEDRFRSIVSDAAASSRLRRRTKSSAFKRFTTRPGIISPLFIVTMKCRDPSLRALATTMLNEQGREGPADGHIMAAIGARLAALETCASVPCSPSAPLAACDVFEGQRVHGYGVSPPRITGEGRRVVDVEFSRPNPPLMQGWGHFDYSSLDNWIIWSEPIDI